MNKKVITHILSWLGTVMVVAAIVGFAFMYLWNWLLPDIIGVSKISYVQSIGILVMMKLVSWSIPTNPNHEHHLHEKKQKKTEAHRHHNKFLNHHEDEAFDDMYERWWKEKGSKDLDDFITKLKSKKS